jgi:hypothetical protein
MMIRQTDIARHTGFSPMTISRAVRALGKDGNDLSDHAIVLLLTAGELTRLGLAWHVALELVRKFDSEIRYLRRDPDHRTWILFIERAEISFQIACMSLAHYNSVSAANPLALTLALHEPVALASEQFRALRAMKEAA